MAHDNVDSYNANEDDQCRFCRGPHSSDRPLYHPCLCTGSIKFIHQECLTSWLRHSGREYCELCKHKFTFHPIYRGDMPPRLPMSVLLSGLYSRVSSTIWRHLHNLLVAVAWLIVVPLCACRISRWLFAASVRSVIPWDLLSQENLLLDICQGAFIVCLNVCCVLAYLYLRDQISQVGGPEWLQVLTELETDDEDIPVGEDQENEYFEANEHAPDIAPEQDAAPAPNVDPPLPQPPPPQVAEPMNMNAVPQVGGRGFFRWILPFIIGLPVGGGAANAVAPAGGNIQPLPGVGQNADLVMAEVDVPNPQPPQPQGNNNDEPPVEDFTWERLFGLDGSMIFLEHVFGVVSLNTLFTLVFAFCPYHLGRFILDGLKINLKHLSSLPLAMGFFCCVIGYLVVATVLLVTYEVFLKLRHYKICHIVGMAYLVIKVALVSLTELGLFPLLCGLWIDICSLRMFNVTVVERIASLHYAPVTFTCMHWMVGMMYIVYVVSFALLAKSMLRPGLLWFFRDINDQEFNPATEMIQQPVLLHLRRYLSNTILIGSTVVLLIWIPVEILRRYSPSFLPFTIHITHKSPLDYFIEVFFLQMTLPLIFDARVKNWLKALVSVWCKAAASLFGLQSYIIGNRDFYRGNVVMLPNGTRFRLLVDITSTTLREIISNHMEELGRQERQRQRQAVGVAQRISAEDARKHFNLIRTFVPFARPSYFRVRTMGLLLSLMITSSSCSLFVLIVPVSLGRWLTRSVLPRHDLLSVVTAFISLGLLSKLLVNLPMQIQLQNRDIQRVRRRACATVICCLKYVVLVIIFGVFVPVLLGILVNLVVISPFRIPFDKTIVFSFWEHWLFGVMHLKMVVLVTLLGPMWWMRHVMEQVQDELFRHEHMRLLFILQKALPGLCLLIVSLTAPYCVAFTISPLFNFNPYEVFRNIYLYATVMFIVVMAIYVQVKQVRRLYNHIKDETYLIGQRLANYEPFDSDSLGDRSLVPVPVRL